MMSWVELRALSSLCRCQGAATHTSGPSPPASRPQAPQGVEGNVVEG